MEENEILRQKIKELEEENARLRNRINELEEEKQELQKQSPRLNHLTLNRVSAGPNRTRSRSNPRSRASSSRSKPTETSSETDSPLASRSLSSLKERPPSTQLTPSNLTSSASNSPQLGLLGPNLMAKQLGQEALKRRHTINALSSNCGLDRDLKKKLDSKYDPRTEEEVRDWIRILLGEDLGANLHESLKSGVILCQIINKLQPKSVVNIGRTKTPFMMMENINNYLKACSTLGLATSDLFQTIDLFEAKNMTSVLINIHTLGRFASKVPGYTGPCIVPK